MVEVHGRTSPPVKDVPCQGALDEGGQPCLWVHGVQLLQGSCHLVSGAPICPQAEVNNTECTPTFGGLQAGRIQLPPQAHVLVPMQVLCKQAPVTTSKCYYTEERSLLDGQQVDLFRASRNRPQNT